MHRILKLLIVSAFLILTLSCKNQKIPGRDEYIAFPAEFKGNLDFRDYERSAFISFYVLPSDKKRMKGNYDVTIKGGSPFLKGKVHYTKRGLVFDYPDEVDFSKCKGTDSEKQEFIDFYFSEQKKCFWKAEPELRIFDTQGFYTYKDLCFTDNLISKPLYLGDETTVEGYSAIIIREYYTVKDTAPIYKKPDFNSPKIPVTRIYWDSYKSNDYTRIISLQDEYEIPAWKGLRFEAKAKTIKPVKKHGTEYHWYWVDISSYCNERRGWIFEEDLIALENQNQIIEYYSSIIDRGVESGLIKTESINADKLPKNLEYFCIGEEGESELYYNDEEIFLMTPYTETYAKLPRKMLRVEADGFLKLDLGSKKILLIDGERISQCFRNFQNDGENKYDESNGDFHNYNFKSISSSSTYKEVIKGKTINYAPENLYKCFYVGCRCHPYWWNYSHIPWVEGVEGNGIGESIIIEFKKDMYGISILNGYTDINNMKLFKENSRVKKLLVEDLVNGITKEMFFEDAVYFNYLNFTKPTAKIKLTIKDVYAGSKYNDTCISAIIPSEVDFSIQEHNERIQKQFLREFAKASEKSMEDVVKVF